jgi:hypothetical protein
LKTRILIPALLLTAFNILSCSDDDPTNENASTPFISGMTPSSGIVGNEVTIAGQNFSAVAEENLVTFNNIPATVVAASATELTVSVPADATTGKVKVTVNDKAGTSQSNFTILAPTITSVKPMIGSPGLHVMITGTNFSTEKSNNIVTFGATAAVVHAASGTDLDVIVPASAATGKITVKVGSQSVVTENNFEYCEGHPELIVSNITITNKNTEKTQFTFSFTITNVGSANLDLAKFLLQNWVSADDVLGQGDAAAGGTILNAGGVLAQGESYQSSWQSSVDFSSKPYLIMEIKLQDGQTVAECNTANNIVAHRIE